jgi:hypothetical protein
MQPSTFECRASAGVCDVAETCSGTSAACPSDAKSTDVCRPSVGGCDPAESCNGTSNNCPADLLSPAVTLCRPAADVCDRAEVCTGTSPDCPPDTLQDDGTPCTDGDRCTIGDVCQTGTCVGTTPDGPCPDRLLCYKAKSTAAFHPLFGYHLVDDFEDRVFNVAKPRGLCQPAETNGEPVIGPSRRLDAYAMKSAGGVLARQTNVRVVNEIGSITLNTGKPDLLRVPAALPSPPPDPNGSIDHYKCYKSFITPGTPRLQRGIHVSVSDGFTNPPKTFVLSKASHLCMPTDAEEQGILDRKVVFLCYAASPAKGEPRHTPQIGVHLNDEFGGRVLNTVKELELCVPSIRLTP